MASSCRVGVERGIYQLDRRLLPAFAARRVASITVEGVAALLTALRRSGCSSKTSANALATLQSILRFARRQGWIVADPVELLERDERPRPQRRANGSSGTMRSSASWPLARRAIG